MKKRITEHERFHEIVRTYSGYVFTVTFRLLGNVADAEDATQETFIKAYRNIERYDDKRGMKNWLFTIAINTARDFYRKSRSTRQTESDAGTMSDGHVIEPSSGIGERIDTGKMLSILDFRYRTVVVLFYMEQYSIREISTMIRKSESVVKVWLFRARKKIMERFGDSAV